MALRDTRSDSGDEGRRGWSDEISSGQRFEFGDNWTAFLKRLTEDRIRNARKSLMNMLAIERLGEKSFVDAGSGSGLFSLAAHQLGARVTSFDYDPKCVACTAELKRRYFPGDKNWSIHRGSVLDLEFLSSLGRFDIVYSWGVLHHTGSMFAALDNVTALVAPGGLLFISIYNDQGLASRIWAKMKKAYVKAPAPLKWAVLLPALLRLWGPAFVRDFLQGRPFHTWRSYGQDPAGRGMDPWRDLVDWVGGYPFEVARPEQIVDFCRERGFELQRLKTCGGRLGCNEFVFAFSLK